MPSAGGEKIPRQACSYHRESFGKFKSRNACKFFLDYHESKVYDAQNIYNRRSPSSIAFENQSLLERWPLPLRSRKQIAATKFET